MRLAIHDIAIPNLDEKILAVAPNIELVRVPLEGEIPTDLTADAFMTIPMGSGNLKAVLTGCKGLKWVHVFGTGTDNFPVNLMEGIQLSCSRGATAVAIAEWAMAMILAEAKGLPENWAKAPPFTWNFADLKSLDQQTLGLIGFGSIGQAIAKRALAFDMQVIAKVRRHRKSTMLGVDFVNDLSTLLQQSDHLVLALPATSASQHLLNAKTLSQCKEGTHIVNIARANIIDHEALKAALDSGHIKTASLDVTDPEPLPEGHWLYCHKNVKLSPHISWNSPKAFDNMTQVFLDNVKAFSEGRPLEGLVDLEAGY